MKVKQFTHSSDAHAECAICDWVSDPDLIQYPIEQVRKLAKNHTRKTGHATDVTRTVYIHYSSEL